MFAITSIEPGQVEAVARLHCDVFAGSMNARLGIDYVKALINWFVSNHNRFALAAVESPNQIVGYVLGTAHSELGRMTADLLAPAFRGLLRRPWLLLDSEFRKVSFGRLARARKVGAVEDLECDLPHPVFSLVGIGVSTKARGKHIGKQLMTAFEQRSIGLGANSLELTVRKENGPAIHLYRSCGWREHSDSTELPTTIRFSKVPCAGVSDGR